MVNLLTINLIFLDGQDVLEQDNKIFLAKTEFSCEK